MRQAGTQSIGIGANGIWGNRGAIGEEGNDGRRRRVNSPSGGLLNSADDGGLSNPRNRYRKALETSHRGPEGPAHVRRRLACDKAAWRSGGRGRGKGKAEAGESESVRGGCGKSEQEIVLLHVRAQCFIVNNNRQ